jgi:hypothetical protein
MLRDLSAQPLTSLRPEFQKAVENFKGKVEAGTRPKQMMGRVLNGEMLVTLIKSYTSALNSGGVPVISSAWERVLATQCNDAKAAALSAYEEDMKKTLTSYPIPEIGLVKAHNMAKAKAKEFYWSKISARDDEKAIETASKLKEELRKLLETARSKNLEASVITCEAYVKDLFESFMNKSSSSSFIDSPAKDADSRLVIPSILSMKEVLAMMEAQLEKAAITAKTHKLGSIEKASPPLPNSPPKAPSRKPSAPTAPPPIAPPSSAPPSSAPPTPPKPRSIVDSKASSSSYYGPNIHSVLNKDLSTTMLDEIVIW